MNSFLAAERDVIRRTLTLVAAIAAAPTILAQPDATSDPAGTVLDRVLVELEFRGNRTIAPEALASVAGLSLGSPWSDDVGRRAHERLRNWPALSAVGAPQVEPVDDPEFADRSGVRVTFELVEAPILRAIEWSGNDALSDPIVAGAIHSLVRVGDPIVSDMVSLARANLEDAYARDGFLLATIHPDLSEPAPGHHVLTFSIREGHRVHLIDVEIRGARSIPARELHTILVNQPRRLFGLAAKGYYVPREVAADVARLERYYRRHGWVTARAAYEGIEFNRARTGVRLAFRVDEGRRWKVRGLRIEGHRLFPTAVLERAAGFESGGFYDAEEAEEARERLSRFYQTVSQRIPQIEPRPVLFPETAELVLVLDVAERAPIVVEELRVTGNRLTRDRVVRQDVALRPGEPFTAERLKLTLERIAERGIFADAAVEVLDGSEPGRKIVDVVVTEKDRPGIIEAGGGATTGAGEVGFFRLAHENFDLFRLPAGWRDWRGAFVGGGQSIELTALPGNRESSYQLLFSEPYLGSRDLALRLRFGGDVFSRRSYDETHVRADVELRRFLLEDHRLSSALAFVVDRVRIEDLEDDAPLAVRRDRGTTWFAYPELSLRWDDTKFNFFSGRRGLAAELRGAVAGDATGSEWEFWRAEASAEYSVHLFDRRIDLAHRLHFGARLSLTDGLGDGTHIAERFFLGGPRDFRGFAYRRLGPHGGVTPIGGEAALHGTVRYSFPLVWREVRGMALFDWGTLEPRISRLSPNRFRTAAGGGIEVRLPGFGTADIFFVEALARERGDRDRLFGITLGVSF